MRGVDVAVLAVERELADRARPATGIVPYGASVDRLVERRVRAGRRGDVDEARRRRVAYAFFSAGLMSCLNATTDSAARSWSACVAVTHWPRITSGYVMPTIGTLGPGRRAQTRARSSATFFSMLA